MSVPTARWVAKILKNHMEFADSINLLKPIFKVLQHLQQLIWIYLQNTFRI